MSYAISNNMQSCRAINRAEDVADDEHFSVTPLPVAPTAVELAALATNKRDGLLATAATKIGPLQDAVELDLATDSEVELLKLWKRYRVELNRIEQQEDFPAKIEWPTPPDQTAVV
ncbi:tail fiber assembly protein [Pseudomonas chlororaphis]|uniref:tail fiber assembly protein n=1 Tax=Pseudomonas chlororaphis TaxID=587753 RepID=UPI00209B42A3|nr:tail fiber assembly protein [Pseudomonas chlororaphis]MCO7612858.1 tail fiber assembly protein [Pseudomonas chlororaphis]